MKAFFLMLCIGVIARGRAATWFEADTGYTWTYEKRDGGVVIENHPQYSSLETYERAVSPVPQGNLVVPSKIEGFNVVAIGNSALFNCEELISVVVPTSVVRIGRVAFHSCRKLETVEGTRNVRSYGAGAFEGCEELVNVDWSEKLEMIDEFAFCGCHALSSANVNDGLKSIGRQAYYDCRSLTDVIIPASVTNVDLNAFNRCENLRSLAVQDGSREQDKLLCLKAGSFGVCLKLKSIKLPDNVISIDGAFTGCAGVREVEIPTRFQLRYTFEESYNCIDKVTIPSCATNIATFAFSELIALTNIIIPAGIQSIGSHAFSRSGVIELHMPEGIKTVSEGMCFGCGSLRSISIPDSVGTIRYSAFEGCSNLTSVAIPMAVTNVEYRAFGGCLGLREACLPGELSFSGSVFPDSRMSISNITILRGSKEIGNFAYRQCSNLVSVTLSESVNTIGGCAFEDCVSLPKIDIPDTVREIGAGAFCGCMALTSFDIPKAMTNISHSMFFGCSSLKEISIPEGVIHLGESAFQGCSELTRVSIPASVVSYGSNIFEGCNKISDVIIPGNFRMWRFPTYQKITHVRIAEGSTIVDDHLFAGCISLESIHIPDSVVSIGEYAFNACKALRSVRLPKSVEVLKKSAFGFCDGLEWISFDGPPPAGIAEAGIDLNMLIWYSADYASDWASAVAQCGFQNARPFIPYATSTYSGVAAQTVNVVVTNVVVHLVKLPDEPNIIVPDSDDVGFVTVVTEIKGGAVSIPSTWKDNYPGFEKAYGADLAKAYTKKTGKIDGAGNELLVWQDYVAGTDPTDKTDSFKAAVTIVDGKPLISYSPLLSEVESSRRKYIVWGKVRLQDREWTVVESGTEADYNFFKVTVEIKK